MNRAIACLCPLLLLASCTPQSRNPNPEPRSDLEIDRLTAEASSPDAAKAESAVAPLLRRGEASRRAAETMSANADAAVAERGARILRGLDRKKLGQVIFKGFVTENSVYEESMFIFSVDWDGMGLQRIAAGNDPSISPDGTIVAWGARDGKKGLVLYEVATGRMSKVCEGYEAYEAPSWSADGRFLAFSHSRSATVVVYDRGRDAQSLHDFNPISNVFWDEPGGLVFSSDSHTIFYSQEVGSEQFFDIITSWDGLFAYDLDGHARRRLSSAIVTSGDIFVIPGDVRLVLGLSFKGQSEGLYYVDGDSGGTSPLAEDLVLQCGPAAGPDVDTLLFAVRSGTGSRCTFDSVNLRTRQVQTLAGGVEFDLACSMSWIPSTGRILAMFWHKGETYVATVDPIDGSLLRLHDSDLWGESPVWIMPPE